MSSKIPTTRHHRRARGGQAMIEFVLVVPLLATVLVLTFFFGWAMKNQQQTIVADRYAAWQGVLANDWPTGGEINTVSLGGQAATINVDYPVGTAGVVARFAGEINAVGPEAAVLAQDVYVQQCPQSHYANLSTVFPTSVGLWASMNGDISWSHIREGLEWRRGQMYFEEGSASVVGNTFYPSLDQALGSIPSPGDTVGTAFRQLYLTRW
ncbi:MAG: pilus assembly protein [Planctomycetaceae bacterium]|nr:pilus assembly protein [Planctomycetaceae bacterium]